MSRLDAYQMQTEPLVAYYDAKGTLRRVNAMGEIDTIAQSISKIVSKATT
jgi:adenylate kinase